MAGCWQCPGAADQLTPNSICVVRVGTVVEPAADHLGPPKTTSIPVSNYPGPADENVGYLSPTTTDLQAVAAKSAARLDGASIQIPTKGTEGEESLALAAVVYNPKVGCCCFPETTDCPANDCGLMIYSPGFLSGYLSNPET